MWYSRIQKFISGILIFSLLFSLTFRVSFEGLLNQVFAWDTNAYNIVSIIVQDDLYNAWVFSSDVKSEIDRYAEDIQKTLPMTKVIIIPTKTSENPYNIASLNEKLYFEWYKWIKDLTGESKLIWSIFVWNIPLPVVYDGQNSQKSVFPYVDFQDKAYIYNTSSKKYEKNQNKKDKLQAEIWHSFISPNTWDKSKDVQELKDFFDKDHNYYTKSWNFSTSTLATTKPYVFYFDGKREQAAISYQNYLAYVNYLLNIEDISYNRFSKYLADKLAKSYLWTANSEIASTLGSLGLNLDLSSYSSTPDFSTAPDISTLSAITKTIKRFVEIFNESGLSDMKAFVHNAWRYNWTGSNVSVDMAPYLITQLDEISRVMVKNANNDLETEIDNLVKNWLSRNIAIPTQATTRVSNILTCGNTYTNILFGEQAKDITTAADCSIYRGSNANSWTLVEANRWLNVTWNAQADASRCNNQTSGWWGGNSPLNLDMASMNTGLMKLWTHDLNKAITPLFDISWASKELDNSKTLSPLNCFDNNFLLSQRKSMVWHSGCQTTYQIPINWESRVNWNCSTTNQTLAYTKNFNDLYKESVTTSSGFVFWWKVYWSGNVINKCTWLSCEDGGLKIDFKKIPSYIEHKSPDALELKDQTKTMTSPNLPIDKDRYIDFIGAKWQYDKINYPYLYRLTDVSSDLSLQWVKDVLKKYLDAKSVELNSKISSNNPWSLSGNDLSLYNLLKTWNYPSQSVDLYKVLETKPVQTIDISWEKKDLSYLDTLVFSLYWSKLNSVSAKYKFVFENYLSDQFGDNNLKFPLPSNKKMYEMAYIWSEWDAKNMYINIDPSGKAENPYGDIIANNLSLNNNLLSTNLNWKINEADNNKCAPPDWVPLRQWLPAVMCRLKTLLPPKIKISAGSCWWNSEMSSDDQINLEACNKDDNKNWINDCQEKIASVKLAAPGDRIWYNSVWNLEASLLDEYSRIVWFDNLTNVNFDLTRVDIPRDPSKELSDINYNTFYDKRAPFWSELNNSLVLEDLKKYISFTPWNIKANNWKAIANFVSKDKEVKLYFRASISIKDANWNNAIDIKSNDLNISVSSNVFWVSSYNLAGWVISGWASWVKASDRANFFIIDWGKTSVADLKSALWQASTAREKYIFDLKNTDKTWKAVPLSYPLKVAISKWEKPYINTFNVPPIGSYYSSIASIKDAGTYTFEITDNSGFRITKEVEVMPDVPAELRVNMSTNIAEIWGSKTNHLLSLYDRFWNLNSGELYNINASINWDFTFGDGKKDATINTFEWYKTFTLKSPDSTWNSEIKFTFNDSINNIKLEKTANIKAISWVNAVLNIENPDNIKVWNNTYKYTIKITDLDGNLLNNFNSKAYLNIPKIYGKSLDSFVSIQNWVWNWSFTTATAASKVVNLTFNVEWLKNSIVKPITIHPDTALKIDLSLSNSKLEARADSTSILTAELKDRYGNLVFDDNSTSLALEIPADYKHIIKVWDFLKTASSGKVNFVLNATDIPWIAFMKVSSNPNLSLNSFSVPGQAGFLKTELNSSIFKTSAWLSPTWDKFFYELDNIHYRSKYNSLDVMKASNDYKVLGEASKIFITKLWNATNNILTHWVWENAIRIDTYYFWNKQKIEGKKYNSLYTTLLWGEYGDINTPDYLASGMLFNKNNRSLAVTTLLSSNKNSEQKLVQVSPTWKIGLMSTTDLSQDVSLNYNNSSRRLSFDLYNDALSSVVWKIYLKWNDTVVESVCDKADVSSCISDNEISQLTAKTIKTNYAFILDGDKIVLKDELWNTVFSISKDFTIANNGGFNISVDNTNTSDYLKLNLEDSFGETVWNIGIKLSWFSTDLSRDESLFQTKIDTLNNTVFVYLQSNNYGWKFSYTWNSTYGNKWLYIYYNDPFADNQTASKTMWEREDTSIANYEQRAWIGWEWENKSLLLFAAGENVWDATKYNQTLSVINLWDPVIALAKVDPKLPGTSENRNFDSSIGKLLWKWVKSYDVFDYNNDQVDDIIYLTADNFIRLLEWTNTSEKYKDMWNLFYIKDLDNKFPIITWDFTNDGFDDIFFVNTDGKPVLLNNYKKHFTRLELEWQFALNGRISQVSGFDMNHDGKMDITTLDENGDINVFYGWWTDNNPSFEKKHIDSGYWLKLDSTPRNDNSAIYYNGLYQLPSDSNADFLKSSEALNANVKSFNDSVWNWSSESLTSPSKWEFNESLLNNMLFFKVNYDPEFSDATLTQDQNKQSIFNALPQSAIWDSSSVSTDISSANNSFKDFTSYLDQTNSGKTNYDYSTNTSKLTTFLRSEYSDTQGINIKKTYTDKNWGFLKAWDQVSVKVEITNTSSSITKNIAYLDKVPAPLSLWAETNYKFSVWWDYKSISPKNPPDWAPFSFMIDHFDLLAGQTAVFEYNLETMPFDFGSLQTGLFEKWELWDDIYWDILLKKSNQNCAETNAIYRSTDAKTYEKGEQTPICNENKAKLPTEAEKNATDKDGNWTPDYIDALKLNNGQNTDFTKYAKDALNQVNFDKDWDGIPDTYDLSPNYNEDSGNILDWLNNFTANSMATLDGVENFINWLGCWFGWAWCIASPLNRAPLAPGNDPTIFGCPAWDGLNVWEWIPVFSMLTMQWYWPICWPSVWPPSPLGLGCSSLWAGWRLGTSNPINQFRFFITPTITGGIWIAACFGGPAIVAWNSVPKWVSPVTPGWNCIVAAKKSNMCKDDWSDWDVWSIGYSQVSGSSYSVINGNCKDSTWNTGKTPILDNKTVADYLNYKRTGQKSPSLWANVNNFFGSLSNNNKWHVSNGPLISLGGTTATDNDMDLSLSLDANAVKNGGSYADIVKIDLKRIFPFPDFIMEWWTRQIEEIVTKLTDWPTIFVILPDFSWIIDSWWSDFFANVQKNYDKWLAIDTAKDAKIDNETKTLQKDYDSKCSDDKSKYTTECIAKLQKIKNKENSKYTSGPAQASGIRQVYEFLGNLPMISILPEKIYISIPWIDGVTIDKAIRDFKLTQAQWTAEVEQKQKMWSGGLEWCDSKATDSAKAQCKRDYAYANSLSINAWALTNSLNQNIQALEEYKKLPEKVNKMISIKETRLGQILCNVETISYILGWRLWENGKRFKAWVELYILVKSILKSWQLVLDVFYDYDASCHDCKNERSDLLYCVFKIISMIIPKIPIIQFPKWPDIIVDLHNVRANLAISLPDFEFKLRPIILPTLPRLYLPDLPRVNINLPSIPVLPIIELPTLPDLPSLPTVTLPDLPPPPKLPKLFAWIEWVLNILKLITKVMCILKKNPFVPEWRAGDQIAFLTERWGYLPIDFLSVSLPQFSYPFVDAIKVTSYVNLEFEADFITEFSRNMVMPLNTFTNNIVHTFDSKIPDLDFRWAIPQNIDVNAWWQNSWLRLDGQKLNYNEKKWVNLYDFSRVIAANISAWISYIIDHKDATVSNKEFLILINKDLAKKSITSDPRTDKIRDTWASVNNYDYAKEDSLINDLIKNNTAKFDTLKSILQNEINETRKLKEQIKSNKLTIDWTNKLASASISRFDSYNSSLSSFNDKTKKSLVDLVTYDNAEKTSLQSDGKDLINRVSSDTAGLNTKLLDSDTRYKDMISKAKSNLLASTATWTTSTGALDSSAKSCKTWVTNTYTYKWLYIIEKDISYRLFDYLWELTGNEVTKTTWMDANNKDLVYQVWDELYLKDNFKATSPTNFYTGNPIVMNADDIKSYNNTDTHYAAVNEFSENLVDTNNINVNFLQSSDDIANYRLEFYNIVDKFANDDNSRYWNGLFTKRQIVDAFRDIDDITIDSTNETYTTRKNLAYIDYYSPGLNVTLSTKELISIKDKIASNTLLNISQGTKIYSGRDDVKIFYHTDLDAAEQSIVLKKHSNISFAWNIIVSWLEWEAYLEAKNSKIYSGNKIASVIGLPIFPGDTIKWDSISEASRVSINYYDGSNIDVLFNSISSYTLYDLWAYNEKYLIRAKVDNDFYYSKITWFKAGNFTTSSAQEIMSPQVQADTKAPELDMNSVIKVPVYIWKTIDLTDSLYENSGISGLKEVYIDSNLKVDSDNDGNPANDKDSISKANIEVQLSSTSLKLKILPFDSIFTKNIRLYMVDKNNNIWYKDLVLTVYSPIPEVKWNNNSTIFGDLNEEIISERVDLYRYRWGVLKRLTKDYVNTSATWAFQYNYNNSQGLVLKDTSNTWAIKDIANINETTWKIDLKDNKYSIRIIPANSSDNAYTNIVVSNWSLDLYYEYIVVPNVWEVKSVDAFDNIKDNWTYFRLTDKRNYSSFTIPTTASYNPWDLAVYDVADSNKTPIFVVTKDWRVSVNRTWFKIVYETFQDRIVYKLVDNSWKEIARVLPISEGNFIMK